MIQVNKNIKFLRTKNGLTQRELAAALKVKTPVIGAYEEDRATPPLECLVDIAAYFGVSLDMLTTRDLSKTPEKEWKDRSLMRGHRVLAITVDEDNEENVELVSQKAAAGYLNGYQDPEYIAELPKMDLPMLPRNATIRAFEISGDSMVPVQPGTIMFGIYVENLSELVNGRRYILVTKTEGIVFKRVYSFPDREHRLLMVSDNKQYEPYLVNVDDVLEVWEARALFSSKLPEHEEASTPLAAQLALKLVDVLKKDKR